MNAQINFKKALQVQGTATEASWNELDGINKAIRESHDVLNLKGFFRDDDNRGAWIVFVSEQGRELYCTKIG